MYNTDSLSSNTHPRSAQATIIICVCLTLLLALGAAYLGLRAGYGGIPLIATMVTFASLLLSYFLLGTVSAADKLSAYLTAKPKSLFAITSALFLLYLIYAVGTNTFQLASAVKILAYIFAPTAVIFFAGRGPQSLTWQDVLVISMLWLPLDFRWTMDSWRWPRGQAAYAFNSLLVVNLGVALFISYRKLEDAGYRFRLRQVDIREGLFNFFLFAAIGLPLGYALNFIAYNHRALSIVAFLLSVSGIFLFIAIPEELLFRGIIQNLLQKTFKRPYVALIISALIFGAAHLNNGQPQPNWRYFLPASIAGVFYGLAFMRARSLIAPAIVHTLVDMLWGAFFR